MEFVNENHQSICYHNTAEKSLEQLFQGAPTSELSKDQYSQGMKVADFLTAVGAATSKGVCVCVCVCVCVMINHGSCLRHGKEAGRWRRCLYQSC